ncbi:ATP-binding cassette domain-containing protein [Leucobacter insecticola]|uniref:ATP-binding cassette domain-containing protein n=1 Tax=Leucobacter insecticola TaxID=2714934 RepID=UPI0019804D8A|nr:ATP-binding cassette domain-containing protein [Leucobacter insecticola]
MDPLATVLRRIGPPPIIHIPHPIALDRPAKAASPSIPIGPPPRLPVQEDGLRVCDVDATVANKKRLLHGVSVSAWNGTLTAVVGPSGAGKSTFVRTISGLMEPSRGTVTLSGINVHRYYDQVKTLLGMVPQEDVIHSQLTLVRALRYAAKLRLSTEMNARQREARVQQVLAELDLAPHQRTRVARLSGGQRKRASIALELLTEPKFLVLDEPTSGLDPALDRRLMEQFRALADGGRTVLAVTHSVACLDICDQVVVLAPGGEIAFIGNEPEAWRYFGTEDWSEIFEQLKINPRESAGHWQQSLEAFLLATEPITERPPKPHEAPTKIPRVRQFFTLVQRQLALMLADRGYTLFLLALPFVVGLLPIVVPGNSGLTQVTQAKYSQEPQMILTLLTIGSIFMGISMTIRELIGERHIYRRERAMGLSTSAYLAAKILVFGALGAAGAVIIVMIATTVKQGPSGDGVLGLGAYLELGIAVTATVWGGVFLGLLLSSLVTSQNQVMPVLVVVLMLQMVLNGGLIPLVDNAALNWVASGMPARWSFSLGAISIDLHHLLELADESERMALQGSGVDPDPAWNPSLLRWGFSAAILTVMAALMSCATWVFARSR